MARKSRRALTGAELALWARVAETVTPFAPDASDSPAAQPNAPPNAQSGAQANTQPQAEASRPAPPRILRPQGPPTPPALLQPPADSAPAPIRRGTPGLDRGTARRMARGLRKPDAKLDLHGRTMERAHAALSMFVHDCAARGLRCVLIVTGKGRDERGARGQGVLRRSVPHWLDSPDLRHLTTGVFEAHQRHGGSGALYVFLRKRR